MRIAMIGLGFMGSTHLKALAGIPAAQLYAVASDVPQQLTGDLSGIQGNLGGPGARFDFSNVKKYADWRDAVRDPGVEAVDICLPTHLHLPVATAALEAGKHVLVEKPMARDGEEAWKMAETARKAGRVLMVAQVLRFLPEYMALRETISSGRLGTVRGVLFRRRCGPPKWNRWVYDKSISGGGAFDLLIHDVDFALHLFGKPQAVSAIGREDMAGGVDWVTGAFHYPDVAVAITGGWHAPQDYPFSMEYSAVGDAGTLEFNSAGKPVTLYTQAGVETVQLSTGDGYQSELEYFVECCRTGKTPVLCTPEDSAETVRLARALCDARACQGQKVEV